MKRILFYKPGDIRVEDTPIPVPGPGEVVVQNKVTLTCGTDVKTYKRGYRYDPPFAMGNAGITLENLAFSDNNFFDMLTEQLAQVPGLSEELRQLCEYLIQCLSDNGYLEFDLLEIAAELRVPLFHLEQALYVVQDLQPAGVGARTLEECLILQLAQGPNFNQYTIGLVKNGLPLLAKDDLHSVARLLGCSMLSNLERARLRAEKCSIEFIMALST